MAMVKLIPTGKDYLWGGRRLIDQYGKEPIGEILAESWELSCHPDGCCRIGGGERKGLTLTEYIEQEGKAVLGKNCACFPDFPILIKLIDSRQALSIQVHPSDEYARANEGDNGKTEVWYIVDAGPEAFIYYGVAKPVTREKFSAAVEAGNVTDLLRKVPVKKGEVYFIESGTIHAIGPDILIAEVQQNSNVTYRVFDYNRRDAQGNLRQLHKEKAIAVSNLTPPPAKYDFGGHIALCNYFCVDELTVSGSLSEKAGEESFVSLLCTQGTGSVSCGGERMNIKAGDSIFITADSGEYTVEGNCVILKTTIPAGEKPYRVGIDLGGTNIKVGIVDRQNHIVAKKSVKTLVERPWQEVVSDMGKAVLDLLAEQGISLGQCASVGIGSPGTVDANTGVVVYSNNFDWEHISLVETLKKQLDLPMHITNDANAAALGEVVAGAAAGCKDAVLFTLGTGVGGGIIIEGKVFEGGHAGAVELGHTTLVAGGELCTCGRRGCLESYASATALIRQATRAAEQNPGSKMNELCGGDLSKMDGVIPFVAARAGDEAGKKVVEDYITWLGEGIVNMVNIFRPEKVILSGGVCGEGDKLTNPLNDYIGRYCFAGDKAFVPPVVTAMLGNDAGIIGAANL